MKSEIVPLLCVYSLVAALHSVHLFGSPQTPFHLQTVAEAWLSQATNRPKVNVTLAERLDDLLPHPSSVVFDYTYSPVMSSVLREKAALLVTMWSGEYEQYAGAFAGYMKKLNFTGVRVIVDARQRNWRIALFLCDFFQNIFESPIFRVPESISPSQALEFAGKIIKPTGTTAFAIIAEASTTAILLSAFEAKRLNKAGYVFIVSDEGRYLSGSTLASHGLVYVAREESWATLSREAGEAAVLTRTWRDLLAAQASRDIFASPVPVYSLVNMQFSEPVLIAASPLCFPLNPAFIFPGNSTIIPHSTKVSLPVSINSYWQNSDGFITPFSPWVMRGPWLAFDDHRNRSSILPNFQFAVKSVVLSGHVFNYTFTQQRVGQFRQDLGLLHMPPPFGVNTIYTYQIFREMNITTPMAMTCKSDRMSSAELFPYYVRTRTGNHYCANVVAQMFKFFKWKRLAILYVPDKDDTEEFYKDFLGYATVLGLNITNDEDKRVLPLAYSTTQQQVQVNTSIAHIMHSTVRILMLICSDPNIILGMMYDLGIRHEYLIITSTALSGTMFNGEASEKRRVVAQGALQFSPRTFVGKEGQRVKDLMLAADGSQYFEPGCFMFDSGTLYINAMDYMINQGLDYEDANETMIAMRGTHFIGCGGTVSIAKNSNDRREEEYSLINAHYFPDNDSTIVQDVVFYNPFSVTLVRHVRPIQWPDNSTGIFLDTLVSTFDCPFLESQVRESQSGFEVGVGALVAISVLTIAASVFIWWRYWRKVCPLLESKEEVSADDLLQLLSVPIEFLQFASLAPDSTLLHPVLSRLTACFSVDLSGVLNGNGAFFWLLVNVLLGTLVGYVLLCTLKIRSWDKRLEWVPLWSFFMLFFNVSLPAGSTLLFLPIVNFLSKIFLCFHSTAEELSASFLNNDCYQDCWQGKHIPYAIVCSLGLLVYIPFALYTKPLWQEWQPLLHIRAQPFPLLLKSAFQVLLLSLHSVLSDKYSFAHGLCYLGVMSVYLLFTLQFPPFNYPR